MNNEASIILRVLDKASAPLKAISRSFQTMSKNSRQALADSAKVAAGLGSGMAVASAGAIAYAGKQTADMETALGQVASLGVKDLEGLREAGQKFSNEWAGTTAPEFVRAAYDIKSGINSLSDEGVSEFTRLAGITAKATKATTGEMTSLFATGFGIYREQFKGLSDMEFGRVFSGGLAKAVQDYKTTGPRMQEAIQTLGAAATQSLVPMEEQLSVLGMLQQTMGGSEAGTKYKAFLKDVAKAGGELGLPFLDANKKIKAMPEILDLLRKKYGETVDGIESTGLQQAFGSEESVALIKLLYNRTGALRENTQNLGQAMKDGTALTETMARAMNVGLGEETVRVGQRLNILAEIVGETLTPTLKPLLRGLGDSVVAMQGWVKENPGLVKGILITALVVGVLVAALGAAAVAMTVVNVAVMANPIIRVVGGIVAALTVLVAAGVWLAANWGKVKGWWRDFWASGWGDAVLAGAGLVAAIMLGPIGWLLAVPSLIISNWQGIKEFFGGLIDNITAGWDENGLWGAGEALIMGLWNGMASLIGKVADWLGDKVRGLVDWLPDWAKEKLGISLEAKAQAGQTGTAPGASPTPQAGGPATAATGAAQPGPQPTAAMAAAGPGAPYGITAAQALSNPKNLQFDGTVRVLIEGAPPGTRITQMEEKGDSGLGLEAGLAWGPVY